MLVLRQACRSALQTQNVSHIGKHLTRNHSFFHHGCETKTIAATDTGICSNRCISQNQQYGVNVKSLSYRTFSSEATDANEQIKKVEDEESDSPTEIYRFSRINLARFLSRLKIYQTAVAFPLVSVLSMKYADGTVPYLDMVNVLGLYCITTSMLYLLSILITKLVCILKYDEATQTVHISHLTYWGNRRDISIPVTNIVPLSDSDQKPNEAFVKIETYDKSEGFLLLMERNPQHVKDNIMNILG